MIYYLDSCCDSTDGVGQSSALLHFLLLGFLENVAELGEPLRIWTWMESIPYLPNDRQHLTPR